MCQSRTSSDNPNKSMRSYAILDEQSSDTLVNYSVFDALGITGPTTDYTLTSCAGVVEMPGRMAEGLVVTSLDESFSLTLPTVLECDYISNIRDEIPSRKVVKYHAHLQDLVQVIPEIDDNVPISILIGRDVPDAHYPVLDQRTGPRNSPYAQKLPLGWVVVGETCLHKVHPPSNITVNKTFILPNGRGSICEPYPNAFEIQGSKSSNDQSHVKSIENLDNSIFMKCRDDDSVGPLVDDKECLKLMNQHSHRNSEGNWEAPLPFRTPRQRLPNNRSLALKRAVNLDASLRKDENKRKHFFEFMEKVFERKHAEIAMPLSVLLRFRKEPIAATADIESMFHCFIVNHEHRKFLRFFWYEGNDFNKDLFEYQMRVHVFGNCPSPSVATYCLRKAASVGEQVYGSDVVEFVDRCFYVDDGLISLPTTEEAIDLLHRSQEALRMGGNLRLHKIASNSKQVMDAFEPQDRAKAFKDIDLCVDNLPTQQSLGLNWELDSDSFKYNVSSEEKPFTKRGLLSTVNGIYDPIGFVAPAVVTGKLLLREITSGPYAGDDSLPTDMLEKWMDWTRSLISLENLHIPRCYSLSGLRAAVEKELHVFSDASEQAIAAVVYLKTKNTAGNYHVGFVLVKAKVAPPHGHTIPRLELCAAVLAVQLSEVVLEELDIDVDKTRFYTDSQVVLGYICNQSKLFYKYVENRVERIRKTTTTQQWSHVRTNVNLADSATRTVNNIHNSIWILGPPHLLEPELDSQVDQYPLLEPDKVSEIRQGTNVNVFKSTVESTSDVFRIRHRIERFSEWNSLVKAIDRLKSLAKKFRESTEIDQSISFTTEQTIIRMVQRESFSTEIECIEKRKLFPINSNISNLNPFIDQHGLLRVGGRLSRAEIDLSEKHPIILPKNHHISVLLIRRFHVHVSVKHQGRHFTAGAIRAAGYWIVGEKRLIASILHKCEQIFRRPALGNIFWII